MGKWLKHVAGWVFVALGCLLVVFIGAASVVEDGSDPVALLAGGIVSVIGVGGFLVSMIALLDGPNG